MAFKTASKNSQNRSLRGTPRALRDDDKNFTARVDFRMPIWEVKEYTSSLIATCKACGRSIKFSNKDYTRYCSENRPFHIFYSGMTKEYACHGEKSFILDFKYRKLSDGQLSLIESKKMKLAGETRDERRKQREENFHVKVIFKP